MLRILALVLLLTASACQASPSGQSSPLNRIDGQAALRHVEEMVRHGPHPPGSEAQKKVGAYLIEQLKALGLEVFTDAFTPETPLGPLEMVNIWGEIPGKRNQVIILASHYDSKYFEEFEFVGANDSGSSSGVVLELARVLSERNPTEFTLWFVFFDGEEALVEWTDEDSLYGSRRFVTKLRERDELDRIAGLILLDLIGGKDLKLRRDINSTDWMNSIIWNTAANMGHSDIFLPTGHTAAEDDHIPFVRAGIPAVDLIDLAYAYWHTPQDTIEKLSPRNMEIVGNVVLASLPQIARKLED